MNKKKDSSNDTDINNIINCIVHSALFKKLIKNDSIHLNFIKYITESEDNFIHFLYLSFLYLQSGYNGSRVVCKICTKQITPEKILIFFSNNKTTISILFSSLYCIPLVVVQKMLLKLKPCTNTVNGTYAYDISLCFLNKIKHLGKDNVIYYGIIYIKDKMPNLEYFYKVIMIDYLTKNVECAVLLYSVGSSEKPEHWCGILIDHKAKIFYFYNSLAKQSQCNLTFYNYFRNDNYKFKTNCGKQQFDNNLCGIFALDFVVKMLELPSKKRLEYFQLKYSENENLDDYFKDVIQKNYVYVNDNYNYLINILKNNSL